MIAIIIITILLILAALRMSRYKTDLSLRIFTLVYLPSVLIRPTIIKAANAFLRFASRKEYNLLINDSIKCAFFPKKNAPLLLYIHGGGFFFTAPSMAIKEARRYSEETGFTVAFPDYTSSIDAPYPKVINEVIECLLHFIENKDRYGINGKIYIAGDSAGAALATEAVSYALKHGIKIEKLLLIYPVVDDKCSTPSMRKYTSTPFWNSKLNKKMWDIYLRNGKGEYAVPTEIDNLKDFPTTFIEAEEYDALHDEAVDLYNRLKELNVQATLLDNKGTFHGFDYFINSKNVKASKEARIKFLKE